LAENVVKLIWSTIPPPDFESRKKEGKMGE
jgi:hypothetical protein